MMGSQLFITSEAPEIVINKAHSDLSIRSWQRSEVLVKVDGDGADVQQTEVGLVMGFHDDTVLQVPVNAILRIGTVDGDLSVQGVAGRVTISKAQNGLDVREVGPLRVEGVGDDLTVRGVRGDCWVGGVGDDANIAMVMGSLTVHGVGDELSVSDIAGGLTANVGSDVDLRIAIVPGQRYEIRSGGDVNCRFQSDASAKVSIAAGGEINVRNMQGGTQNLNNVATFIIGDGEAIVDIKAGGEVNIRGVDISELKDPWNDFGADFSVHAADIAQQVVMQIEAQVGGLSRQLDEKLSSYGASEEIAAKIQEKIQSALRRAEERLSEVLKNVDVRINDAELKSRGKGVNWAPTPPPAPKPPKPTRQSASEEERKMVLKMVGDKRISVEQAEQLLRALGGGAGDD
jgi:ElaB/YqjD/DUF883 family membrane-anchored ribosome-binding protein